MKRLTILMLAAIAVPHVAVSQEVTVTVIHVRLDGDDAADGSESHPVRSLARAQELVRALAGGGDVRVVLGGGEWRIAAPLRFGPADGGGDAGSVLWIAAAAGETVISGGQVIRGWTVDEGGDWVTRVPDGWRFRELFVDGERRPRARHPNAGYLRVEAAAEDRRTGFSFAPGDVPVVADLADVELVFLHDWSISRVGVASVDETSCVLTTTDSIGGAAPHYAIDRFEPHPRYFLENSRAYLDRPGEWCLNASTGELRYRPLPDEVPDAVEVVAPRATALIEVRGEPDRPVRRLRFGGLRFEHCAWSIPERGYAEGQANYHEPRTGDSGILREPVPAALRFERAEWCSIDGSDIAHLGGGGVSFGSRCRDCALVATSITDVSGNGVMIGEDQNRTIDGQSWWRVAPEQIATDNAVVSCTIERCGQQFYGAVGIWVGFARDTFVVGNEIRELPYTGISLGWHWNPESTPVGGNLVRDNHIHHVMQVLSDGGGIYTLGRQPGTVLRGNRIHDVPVNAGRSESNGMFLDEGTTDILIEENVIWNVDRAPLRFHRAGTNLVRGNVLVVRGEVPPVRYNRTEPEDITLDRNVVAEELAEQPR